MLDPALIYYVDTHELDPMVRACTRSWAARRPSDDQVSNLTGNVMIRSFLKEIVRDEFQTGALFEPGLVSHTNGGLGIKGELGTSLFAGATEDQFTASQIRLWLSQASLSESQQKDWVISGGLRGGSALNDGSAVGSVSGEMDGTIRFSKGKGTSVSRTGGKELLPLSFHRAYFFVAPVTLQVNTVEQVDGKLRWRRVRPGADTLGPRTMMYLLPEPRALSAYGRDQVRSGWTKYATP